MCLVFYLYYSLLFESGFFCLFLFLLCLLDDLHFVYWIEWMDLGTIFVLGLFITIIDDSNNNASRKAAKKLYKANKKQKDCQELLVKMVNPTDKTQFINWQQVQRE
jgi:hypothetical protein